MERAANRSTNCTGHDRATVARDRLRGRREGLLALVLRRALKRASGQASNSIWPAKGGVSRFGMIGNYLPLATTANEVLDVQQCANKVNRYVFQIVEV